MGTLSTHLHDGVGRHWPVAPPRQRLPEGLDRESLSRCAELAVAYSAVAAHLRARACVLVCVRVRAWG
jgi:hypothetical protein